MSRKNFVVDTNVFLDTPDVINTFKGNNIIISEAVIEELDNFKKDKSDLGYNARETIRQIEEIINISDLSETTSTTRKYDIDDNTSLIIEFNNVNQILPKHWDLSKNDNRILQICLGYKTKTEPLVLISKDTVIRIKAKQIGIEAQDYLYDSINYKQNINYLGFRHVYVPGDSWENVTYTILHGYGCQLEYYKFFDHEGIEIEKSSYIENEFIILHNLDNMLSTILARYSDNYFVTLQYLNSYPFGVNPVNVLQSFMIEALMNSKIPLVICKGPSGTAKTFLSLACGLEKVTNTDEYSRILICRPAITMDEDLGYLPGDEEEKIAPFLRPIYDNLDALFKPSSKNKKKDGGGDARPYDYLFYTEKIVTQAVGFLRGRSIVDQYLIIDEAQNLTANQVKGIITRAGMGTKIVLVGDPDQIDSPYLNRNNNGLVYAANKMQGSPLCSQVTLDDSNCVRSELAKDAILRMI